MYRVRTLINERNVLLVNMFSRNGAIGGSRSRTISELYNDKIEIHNTIENFLSVSAIVLNQDRPDNLISPVNGLLLNDGNIYYAIEGELDIGYTPTNTTFTYLNSNQFIIKTNGIEDFNEILKPKESQHYTELLISIPRYMGFVFINTPNPILDYTQQEISEFCLANNIPIFRLSINQNGIFDNLVQIYP